VLRSPVGVVAVEAAVRESIQGVCVGYECASAPQGSGLSELPCRNFELRLLKAYLNNGIEQDHRGIKGRYKTMYCFKCFDSAARFCDAYDALRDYLRPRSFPYEALALSEQRSLYLIRSQSLLAALGGM
jgi:hypothetical protein